MDLGIVSAAFYPSAQGLPVVHSAAKAGLSLDLYGLRQKWCGFYEGKIVALYSALKRFKHSHVLYCDASDVFIRRRSSKIIDAYRQVGDEKIVISGDAACYPFTRFEQEYRDLHPYAMFPFICAGVFMGPTGAVINALEWMMWARRQYTLDTKLREDDQSYWMLFERNNEGAEVKVDADAKLVASLNHWSDDWFSTDKFRLANGSEPPILHFNGVKTKRTLMTRYAQCQR